MLDKAKKPLTKATWSVPELSVLGVRLRTQMQSIAYEVELQPEEVLWDATDANRLRRYFGVVLQGGMDILREGRLIDVVGRHEVLGLSALLRRPHTATARAIPSGEGKGTHVLLVDAGSFTPSRRGTVDAEIEHAFFRLVVRGSIAVIRRLNAFALKNPYKRFVEMMCIMADEQHVVWHSQRQLAQLLGIDVAQVSRYVKYLTNKKVLTRWRGGTQGIYIAKPDRLRTIGRPNTKQLRR